MHSILLAALGIYSIFSGQLYADDFVIPKQGWKIVDESNQIKVEKLKAEDYIWVRGTVIDSVPIEVLGAVLQDIKNYSQWMPGLDTVRIVKQFTPDHYILYHYYDLPWPVSDRDIFVEVKIKRNYAQGIFESQVKNINFPSEPPKKGVVRIPMMMGKMALKRVRPELSRGSYVEKVNFGGKIPVWIQNIFSRRIPGHVISKLQETYRSGKYNSLPETEELRKKLSEASEQVF